MLFSASFVKIFDSDAGTFTERFIVGNSNFNNNNTVIRKKLPLTPNKTPGNIFANLSNGKPYTDLDNDLYLRKVNKALPLTPDTTPSVTPHKTPLCRLSDMSPLLRKTQVMVERNMLSENIHPFGNRTVHDIPTIYYEEISNTKENENNLVIKFIKRIYTNIKR